ncbi:RNA polymerase sigma factor RpoE [Gemmata obscuriglobus]|uniref:Sigma-70 family RNA polymerase sigma factor n=1 Tax=Gemmata obscuriglobus TaxID=114 RepID=A0A2Z3HBP6_9BACT|nr:sigma-70 family RNA polymerase sigma factor [Gemmata obscuriglobus]AWM39074.1 sigma-70 family RNA polymerase sigma factor [Gemmata obscuriglobus]QEG27890.1 RNA polymerase sigma factor RpoE [Gemmata obscuriglobus]VTS05306.1 sigma-70 family rna polymerase sigma factor : Uncultured bacterium genome assembly Metasoil_fosmids_resub OS=uncultured bacterium PE=4 SV=1: Sigma70_r2 [Gemmata obscuriglobus UQM 2246]
MSGSPESLTRVTLLGRLRRRPGDPDAWAEFVAHYGPKVLAWCRGWGLQDADAQDVAQTVLMKMATRLPDFEYDPAQSFRAWLKTVTHHVWYDVDLKNRRPGRGSGDSATFEKLDEVAARDTLTRCLEDAYDEELLREAMARVRLRVEPRTWEAFRLLALEERPGADVAQRLGMKLATVYVARSKVQRLLRDEIARLDTG